MCVAFHGVSGAGLRIMVLPVASAWPIFWIETSNGKFHGTIAPTTPAASRTTVRFERRPNALPIGSSRSHSNVSIVSAGQRRPSSSGASSCGP